MSSPATSDESGGGAMGEGGAWARDVAGEVCPVVDPELAVEASHVRADRVLAQAGEGRDVDAAVAAHEQPRDLALALAEPLEGRRLLRGHADDGAPCAREHRVALEGGHRDDGSTRGQPERRGQRVALRARG